MSLRFDLAVDDDVHLILERNYNDATVTVTVDVYDHSRDVTVSAVEFIELLKAAGFHDGLDPSPARPTSPYRSATVVDTSDWEGTPEGKLICPDCGASGWPVEGAGPSWLDKHTRHENCPDCGQTCSVRGLKAHRRKHRREEVPT